MIGYSALVVISTAGIWDIDAALRSQVSCMAACSLLQDDVACYDDFRPQDIEETARNRPSFTLA
jgi:hypothetical protein